MNLTDEQIEKALECCQWAAPNCKDCPMDPETPCKTNLHLATLDYIKRLKSTARAEFRYRSMNKVGDRVDGDIITFYDGIITIICDDATEGKATRAKKLYLTAQGTTEDKCVSLNDCLRLIEYDGEGTVMVIFEEPLKGEVYEYGNYSPECWVRHGTTVGYA